MTEPIDRSPPMLYFRSGESFLKAAVHMDEALKAHTLRLWFEMPVYYLYSHAIELTLKAFLRAKGIMADELASRKWGHDVLKLWKCCFARGLTLDLPTRLETGAVIDILAPYATSYEFRYAKMGTKTLPTLDAVRQAAEALCTAVGPVVHATVAGHTLERG